MAIRPIGNRLNRISQKGFSRRGNYWPSRKNHCTIKKHQEIVRSWVSIWLINWHNFKTFINLLIRYDKSQFVLSFLANCLISKHPLKMMYIRNIKWNKWTYLMVVTQWCIEKAMVSVHVEEVDVPVWKRLMYEEIKWGETERIKWVRSYYSRLHWSQIDSAIFRRYLLQSPIQIGDPVLHIIFLVYIKEHH